MASLDVRGVARGEEGSGDENEEDGSKDDDEEAPETALSFPAPLTGGSATKGGGKSVDDDDDDDSGDERDEEEAEERGSFADSKADVDRAVPAVIDWFALPSALVESLPPSSPAPLRLPSPCVLLLLTTRGAPAPKRRRPSRRPIFRSSMLLKYCMAWEVVANSSSRCSCRRRSRWPFPLALCGWQCGACAARPRDARLSRPCVGLALPRTSIGGGIFGGGCGGNGRSCKCDRRCAPMDTISSLLTYSLRALSSVLLLSLLLVVESATCSSSSRVLRRRCVSIRSSAAE